MTTENNTPNHSKLIPSGDTGPPPGSMGLSIDWERYGAYLEDSDLSDEEKIEFIKTLWSIMVNFVDLGFRLSPLDQVCEQNGEIRDFITDQHAEMVELPHQPKQEPTTGKEPALLLDERRHN